MIKFMALIMIFFSCKFFEKKNQQNNNEIYTIQNLHPEELYGYPKAWDAKFSNPDFDPFLESCQTPWNPAVVQTFKSLSSALRLPSKATCKNIKENLLQRIEESKNRNKVLILNFNGISGPEINLWPLVKIPISGINITGYKNLFPSFFYMFDKLEHLSFDKSRFVNSQNSLFTPNKTLKYFSVSGPLEFNYRFQNYDNLIWLSITGQNFNRFEINYEYKNLRYLNLNNNQLKEFFINTFDALPQLEELNLSNNQLYSFLPIETSENILRRLGRNLKVLDLSSYNSDPNSPKNFLGHLNVFPMLTNLEELYLRNVDVNPSQDKKTTEFKWLMGLPDSLKILDLQMNGITDEDLEFISGRKLKKNNRYYDLPSIREVWLFGNTLKNKCVFKNANACIFTKKDKVLEPRISNEYYYTKEFLHVN